jgi:hypothetical protein
MPPQRIQLGLMATWREGGQQQQARDGPDGSACAPDIAIGLGESPVSRRRYDALASRGGRRPAARARTYWYGGGGRRRRRGRASARARVSDRVVGVRRMCGCVCRVGARGRPAYI